jgi:hypothetical protein
MVVRARERKAFDLMPKVATSRGSPNEKVASSAICQRAPSHLPSEMTSPPPIVADINALPRVPDPVPSPTHAPHLDELTTTYTQALIDIRSLLPKELRTPKVGIVCGSGLQGLAGVLQERCEVKYSDVEGFGESTGELRRRGVDEEAADGCIDGNSPRASELVGVRLSWEEQSPRRLSTRKVSDACDVRGPAITQARAR